METYFQSFHEDERFSTNSLLSNVDEVMKDQLGVLESIKIEENVSWTEEHLKNQIVVGKEDFQQLMSDWQQHLGTLLPVDAEDLGLSLDTNLDILNTYSNPDLFEEKDNSILSKALKNPAQRNVLQVHKIPKSLDVREELLFENIDTPTEHFENNQKLSPLGKTESSLIRKITLINGEKEILGKNIIGLHCLNEIKENPDENCQVTSTVINGKRYKIIIKPKSLKVKKLSEDKLRKTLIKKLLKCNLVTKVEPKEDEITSEMLNGNYDVPILNSDLLPSWDFGNLDSYWSAQVDDTNNIFEENEIEPVKKVAPIRIKVPKFKKLKKKKSVTKSDEEIDVETINDKIVEGSTINNLLTNFEKEVAKLKKDDADVVNAKVVTDNAKDFDKTHCAIPDNNNRDEFKIIDSIKNIKSSLPKEMIDRISSLRRKKDRRIPLIQVMPTKKATKSGTRMQDAVATMNRNKLLKIVSGGDTVQLDHDYCSVFAKNIVSNKQPKRTVCSEINLAEKNPKKDSGMESGDVSDASEGPNTPDNLFNIQSFRQMNNKILEQRRRVGDHTSVAKAAIAFFRASNAVTVNGNVNNSDTVKTKIVSNGNKVLTNDISKTNSDSCNSNIVPIDSKIKNEDVEGNCKNDSGDQKDASDSTVDQNVAIQNERPKKKLKLEEYLNRRNIREKESEKISNFSSDFKVMVNDEQFQGNKNESTNFMQCNESNGFKKNETFSENSQKKPMERKEKSIDDSSKKESRGKMNMEDCSKRSCSVSSGERCRRERRRSRSRSGSYWRSSSNSSSSRRREQGKHKYRRSESHEKRKKRRGFWSKSLSRSSSRESTTSSDHSGSKSYKSSSLRYRRRSRSRSLSRSPSRDRLSRSRNRDYSKRRRPGSYYYNRNLNIRRSKSPFYTYSMREKQRQIEERRVIYVGRIEEGMTNAKLRERFSIFGPIIDISLHFREYGDNYGFVTYAFKADAYDAVEHGNDDPSLPHYDLCFGGRRGFCKEKYADLDGMPTSYSGFNDVPAIKTAKDSFDLLLKEAQAKLKNRKKK